MNMERLCNDIDGGNRSTGRKPLSTANPLWSGLGLNPDLRGERPETNHRQLDCSRGGCDLHSAGLIEVLSCRLSVRTEDGYEKQGSRCPGRDSNRACPKYKFVTWNRLWFSVSFQVWSIYPRLYLHDKMMNGEMNLDGWCGVEVETLSRNLPERRNKLRK